jgi:hypothetical protein
MPEVHPLRPAAAAAAACALALVAALATGTGRSGDSAPGGQETAPSPVGHAPARPVPAASDAASALPPTPAPAPPRPVPRGGARTMRALSLVEAGGAGAVANSVAAQTIGQLLRSAGGTVPTPAAPGWLRANPRVTWDGRPPGSTCQPIPRMSKAEVRPVGGPVGPAFPPPRPGFCPDPPG